LHLAALKSHYHTALAGCYTPPDCALKRGVYDSERGYTHARYPREVH